MSENITIHHYDLTREKRNNRNQHKSFVLWFTGLSGSGKSTIANKVEAALFEKNKQVYSLDGDNIRSGINKGLGFTKADRYENLRRIAEVAKLFVDAGNITVAAFVSPTYKDRDLVKNIIGEKDFIEVFVDTSLEECERRDVKGLYKKARAGEIKNFTGIEAPYDAPKNPDIHIKTEEKTVDQAVEEILNHINTLI
ncbi:adenylyl-sulfate kinase [Psychroflexus halocasei]|uniref:Adenylyl-sulfate kinase n=1 Tax=Psychroflexus halocasei TaxID=908615 RepID=A0A1H3VKB8_9FLAO|nr:adenylyl-sulfate kinase [Psychroflexus halocasei]SDZ75220.1 adenylylsulfate kinase [Psychroflexus halocasei]